MSKLARYTAKQVRATELYYDVSNKVTFGNFYQAALAAGFSPSYSRSLTSLKPTWVMEIKKTLTNYEPEHIYRGFQEVAVHGKQDRDKLKALELMGKARGMFIDRIQQDIQIKFVNDVPRPESERKVVESEGNTSS